MSLVREKPLQSTTWWVGIALAALMVFMLWVSQDYRPRAVQFTNVIAVSVLILSLLHSAIGFVRGVIADDAGWFSRDEMPDLGRRRAIFALWGLATAITMWLVGIHVALPLFIFLFIGVYVRNWLLAAILAAVMLAFSWLLLAQTLHVIFPPSVLSRWMVAQGIA